VVIQQRKAGDETFKKSIIIVQSACKVATKELAMVLL